MAGTIPVALACQQDRNGIPLRGCLLYLFQVGTVATPQNAFSDVGLTQVLPWPVVADDNGRLPMFYLADGAVHPRLTDAFGVVQFDYPTMLVVGPSSSSSGGGGTVDPTTVASTGDTKYRDTAEVLTGWVKQNGLTIGSASSGATQRANNDAQNLFVYLWTNFSNVKCPVSTGRGVSALSDFTANKTIQLLDKRGKGPMGLDGMGNTLAGNLPPGNITSGGGDTADTPAAFGGEANHPLTTAELASHTHTAVAVDAGHQHSIPMQESLSSVANGVPASVGGPDTGNQITGMGTANVTVTNANTGGGNAHNTCQPFFVGTWYQKL